jgi:hypothetical protein
MRDSQKETRKKKRETPIKKIPSTPKRFKTPFNFNREQKNEVQ